MKNFDLFISQLSETNATLDYLTDFEKVSRNVAKISIKLNQLNYLLGKDDLEIAVSELFEENPKSFEELKFSSPNDLVVFPSLKELFDFCYSVL